MKNRWMQGLAMGAVVGAAALAVGSMMNQRTRKQMVKKVTDTASMMAEKAEKLMK